MGGGISDEHGAHAKAATLGVVHAFVERGAHKSAPSHVTLLFYNAPRNPWPNFKLN